MNADEIIPELNAPVRKAKARYCFVCVLCNRQDLARYSDRAGLLRIAKNVRKLRCKFLLPLQGRLL